MNQYVKAIYYALTKARSDKLLLYYHYDNNITIESIYNDIFTRYIVTFGSARVSSIKIL